MADVLIRKGVEHQKQHGQVDGKGQKGRGVHHKAGGCRHKNQNRRLDGQVLEGGRGQIPHHGGRHHDGENHAHNGVFRPKNRLEHLDKQQNKHKVQRRVTEGFPHAPLAVYPHLFCVYQREDLLSAF